MSSNKQKSPSKQTARPNETLESLDDRIAAKVEQNDLASQAQQTIHLLTQQQTTAPSDHKKGSGGVDSFQSLDDRIASKVEREYGVATAQAVVNNDLRQRSRGNRTTQERIASKVAGNEGLETLATGPSTKPSVAGVSLQELDYRLSAKVTQQNDTKQKNTGKIPLANRELENLAASKGGNQQASIHASRDLQAFENAVLSNRIDRSLPRPKLREEIVVDDHHAAAATPSPIPPPNEYDPELPLSARPVPEDEEQRERLMQTQAEEKIWKEIKNKTAVAEVVNDNESQSKPKRWAAIGCLLGLLAVILAVTLISILVTSRRSKDTLEIEAAPKLVKFLQAITLEPRLRYPLPSLDPSPSERALNWLVLNANEIIARNSSATTLIEESEKVSPAVVQAFVLATVWFLASDQELDPIQYMIREGGCEWKDATCNEDGEIVLASLSSLSLAGTLPPDIAKLTKLTELRLQRNNFLSGSIPTQFGALSDMSMFFLFQTKVSSSVPTEIGLWTNAQSLQIGSNLLSGSIPSEIGQLTLLETLSLGANKLSGTIPTEMGNLSLLPHISLGFNLLTGSIPTTFGNMKSAQSISLESNQLTGNVPKELFLNNPAGLFLYKNQLSGSLPSEVGLATEMEYLVLFDNKFEGEVPSELGLVTKLSSLILNSNKFNGQLPSAVLNGLPNLSRINLSNNNWNGPLESFIGDWADNLTSFRISENVGLTGELIPARLGNFTNLQQLHLDWIPLGGTISTTLAELTMLTDLSLRGCNLTGTIPSELKVMMDMQFFDVSFNELTGPVSPDLSQWTNVQSIHLEHTSVTGVFPWCAIENGDLFVADCDEIFCECCNVCCPASDGEESLCDDRDPPF